MDKLKQRATVVDADWRGGPVKGLVCAVTFDDAFVSVIDNAPPELAKREMPCTIFVPVAALGRRPVGPWKRIMRPDEIVADPELVKSCLRPGNAWRPYTNASVSVPSAARDRPRRNREFTHHAECDDRPRR